MNIENMRIWIETLESGQYSQTNGGLHDDKGFCCLGVLCDLKGVEWHLSTDEVATDFFYVEPGHQVPELYAMPGPKVLAWLGMNDIPCIDAEHLSFSQKTKMRKHGNPSVAALNDNGFTFAEIASLLRLQYGISA